MAFSPSVWLRRRWGGGGPDICAVGSSKSGEFNPILLFAQARWDGEGELTVSLGRYSTPGSGDQRASGPLFGWQAAAQSPRGRVPRPEMPRSEPPGLSRSERDGGFARPPAHRGYFRGSGVPAASDLL